MPTQRFIHQLAALARELPWAEKRLLAPSLRAGRQWTQQAARLGGGLLNVRVTTLKRLAVDLTQDRRQCLNVQLLSHRGHRLLVEGVWRQLRKDRPRGELASRPWSEALAHPLARTLYDLRLAAVGPDDLSAADLRPGKRSELAELLVRYSKALVEHQCVDDALLFQWAVEAILDDPDRLGSHTRFLVPADLAAEGLARRLLDQLPPDRTDLLTSEPLDAIPAETPVTDLARLRFLFTQDQAPPPVHDDSVRLVRALDPAIEVDNVLRTVLAAGVPLDQVEVLYTDADTYVPLLLEKAAAWSNSDVPGLENGVPVNFAAGIPVQLTRPGRTLLGWLRWLAQDLSQAVLLDLILAELLAMPPGSPFVGSNRTARWVSRMTVGWGKERWLEELRQAAPGEAEDQSETWPRVRAWLEGLVRHAPTLESSPLDWIAAAEGLIRDRPEKVELDEQARHRLIAELRGLRADLARFGAGPRDMQAELTEVVEHALVGGQGPRPGCLHVADLFAGGHSGRPYTFILGLDEDRLSLASLDDPLLGDAERRLISPELATAQHRAAVRRANLARLLARLNGRLTLSYSCVDVVRDEEIGPSEVLRLIHRLGGTHEAEWPAPLVFGPAAGQPALARDEAWLNIGAERWPAPRAEELLAQHYPAWAAGYRAEQARLSPALTPFDGVVPAAGAKLNLRGTAPFTFSAHSLETLGRCPLAFFFERMLDLREPDAGPDPAADHLPAHVAGRVLHEVFHRVTSTLIEQQRTPTLAGDRAAVLGLLDELLQRQRRRHPLPSAAAEAERRQLRLGALLFLAEEERHGARSVVRFVEVSIGRVERFQPSPLDEAEPLRLTLADGLGVRIEGRIDRIDEVQQPGAPEFWVWDYKTGRPDRYDKKDVCGTGRTLQPYLYWELATARLRRAQKLPEGAAVGGFGFFFPSSLGLGDRITWTGEELVKGREALRRLLRLADTGAFLATERDDDCKFCPYQRICDVPAASQSTHMKVAALEDSESELAERVGEWVRLRRRSKMGDD